MRTIILNSSNLDSGNSNNNVFKYTFPSGAVNFKDDQIAVTQVSLYYSWYNINSSLYNNNSFSYTWIDGTIVNVTLPNGSYAVSDINSYLQSVMVSNGHYLVDSTGNYVYFLEFTTNTVYYAVQLNAYAVPTSSSASASSYTKPSGNFYKIVGFSAGTYPSTQQSSTYSFKSDIVPQVSPVQSLIMNCSLLNNRYSVPSNLLFSFSPASVSFGSLITIQPPQHNFVDIYDGQYNSFTIEFRDQNLDTMQIIDTNIVVLLSIRNKKTDL
ncbi:hypothetical protein EBU95_16375 [bacterium]|nr:hypothetical protein [bacterium]